MEWLIPPVLLTTALTVGWEVARRRCQNGCFYSDTPWLLPLGIYVWGDALVLLPFWILLVWAGWWSLSWGVRVWLIFVALRSGFEGVYWITHQVARRDYAPPLLRRISWLKPNDMAIIYQLVHLCIAVLAVAALIYGQF